MSANRLPKDQELKLLQQLSTDDAFRARFEADPGAALKELGVSAQDVANLAPNGFAPCQLADKKTIAGSYQQLLDTGMTDHVCLIFPALRLNYGDKPD